MWRRAVFVQAMVLLAGAWDLTYYTRTRLYPPIPRVECFEYPESEWSSIGRRTSAAHAGRIRGERAGGPYTPFGVRRSLSRTYDSFPFSFSYEDIAKEHAKLVRDINGLKYGPLVPKAQLPAEPEDYDDSIYQEEMDTSTTERPERPARQAVSTPPRGPKRGAAAAAVPALAARPYPRPAPTLRLCLPPAPPLYTKPTPTLLQRLLGGILSK